MNFNFEKDAINLNVYCTRAFKRRNPLLCFVDADVTILILFHCFFLITLSITPQTVQHVY